MNDIDSHAAPAGTATYRDWLRRAQPSGALDQRIASAIDDFSAARASSPHRFWRAPVGPAIAAGATAVLVAGLVLWLTLGGSGDAGIGVASEEQPPGVGEEVVAGMSAAQPHATPDSAWPVARRVGGAFVIEPAGTYSLWPTESAIFRVQTRLDTVMPAFAAGNPAAAEQRFWVDVRVANDGSMRIVRIVPVDEGA